MGQFSTLLVHDFHVDAKDAAALLHAQLHLRLFRQVQVLVFQGAERAQWAQLGHAPSVQHIDTVLLAECRDHGGWASRAANHSAVELAELQARGLHVGEQHLPDGGHPSGKGHAFGFHQLIDRFAVERRAGEHQFGTHHGRAVRDAPGVDVEHGHHRQDRVAGRHAHHVGQSRAVGVQDGGAVAVQRPLGVAGGAAGVAQAAGRVFVDLRPDIGVGLSTDPGFIADQARDARVCGQFVGVAQRHPLFDGGALAVHRLHDGQEGHVKAQHLVFGVVGDPGHLVGVQARVDGVQHAA